MRIPIAVVALVVIAGAIFAAHRFASADHYVPYWKADVNGSGYVTLSDVSAALAEVGHAAPAPTPTPDLSHDVVVTSSATLGNHESGWFGAYRTADCREAVIYLHASGLEPNASFDFWLGPSNDGVTPLGIQNVGNSSNTGDNNGTWVTHRKVSFNHSGAIQGGGNIERYDYDDNQVPYMMIGAFANQSSRFRVEVHCSRSY